MYSKQVVINSELSNALGHDAKHVLSFHNVEKISGAKRSIKITENFTCTSANVIYSIPWTLCKKLYISKTGRLGGLGDRFQEHLRDVEIKTTKTHLNRQRGILISPIILTLYGSLRPFPSSRKYEKPQNSRTKKISADIVRKQLKDLSLKVHTTIQPVFVSRKIEQELSVKETKPPIVNQQCVVYDFQCDLCDAGYVGYTRVHLHNRVNGHKQNNPPPLPNTTRTCTGQCLRAC